MAASTFVEQLHKVIISQSFSVWWKFSSHATLRLLLPTVFCALPLLLSVRSIVLFFRSWTPKIVTACWTVLRWTFLSFYQGWAAGQSERLFGIYVILLQKKGLKVRKMYGVNHWAHKSQNVKGDRECTYTSQPVGVVLTLTSLMLFYCLMLDVRSCTKQVAWDGELDTETK